MNKIKRIGIPRGLLYHRYGSIWKELLESMDYEVITSPRTTESIQNIGLSLSVCDLCLPIKVFFGHVSVLKDDVDAIFIPRYISVEKTSYTCPKFIGLPDMVRAAVRNLPPVIDPVMNLKTDSVTDFISELNGQLKVKRPDINEQLRILGLPVQRDHFFGEGDIIVALTGRPYLVFDNLMNKGIIRYLNSLGVKVFYFIPDLYSVERTMESLPKWVYWSMGKEVVTSVNSMLNNHNIHGIINLVNSACGPDSFMVELINRSFDLSKRSYMAITIDEHTSDVGIQTRIEAFLDMTLKRASVHAGGRDR
ncbi:MAG: acyl-CoA dehydratase activase-related protein [Thermodesulfovibrionales bacterium]